MEEILNKLPFLSVIIHNNVQLIGVIQNCDEKILSFYNYAELRSKTDKDEFMDHCDSWWNESNRQLPINIFIGESMSKFRYCLRTFNRKDVTISRGPVTSLDNIIKNKTKRSQVTLVRRR